MVISNYQVPDMNGRDAADAIGPTGQRAAGMFPAMLRGVVMLATPLSCSSGQPDQALRARIKVWMGYETLYLARNRCLLDVHEIRNLLGGNPPALPETRDRQAGLMSKRGLIARRPDTAALFDLRWRPGKLP